MGVAEAYSQFFPKKLKFSIGHPHAVVETVSLASLDPPDITYQQAFPRSFIEGRKCERTIQNLTNGNIRN